ncbi:hypothetical protein CRI94_15730 [Longibacter salinarum]|uniref:Uncharacterized protein n=1 Tax=Longibacter salinarum TaxID=1850348 RepID=A0A2A8CVB0_9BACT|nr:NirD/YgiW/YdeI family stress tolerance protein [Longibacter salinarum]PEN11481.1 hypothetical protein CRI94_15730 [Longibacter salinarum]
MKNISLRSHFSAITSLVGLLVALLILPGSVLAQYTGPGASPSPSTVAQVLEDPQDDQQVTLRGTILEQLSTEKYMFSDETGQIRIEIESDDFPKHEIGADTRIEISGEVENSFMRRPEIDVENITILPKNDQNGSTS